MTSADPSSSPAQSPLIHTHGLAVGYGNQALLRDIKISVNSGDYWAFVGRNGLGKTTLLRTLIGLLPAIQGQIRHATHLRIGYVPQRSQIDLEMPLRVVDLVADGLEQGWSCALPLWRRKQKQNIAQALQAAECTEFALHSYASLSEGQKQRALLARALVTNPQLLVLDEPTSSMDLGAEHAVLELIDRLRAQQNLTIMMVNHRVSILAKRATHCVYLCRSADQNAVSVAIDDFQQICQQPQFSGVYGQLLHDAALVSSESSHYE